MHKSYIQLIFAAVLFLSFVLPGCKKQSVYNGRPLTISVFNGLDDGHLVYGNYSSARPTSFRLSQRIPNGSALSINSETPEIHASYYVSPDTLDKDMPVFNEQLSVENGKSYSLYLLGERSAVDYLLAVNEFKRYTPEDSVTYMQIVNISNDQPVSVNIKGEPNGSMISSLPYKGITEFTELNADANHSSYEFEFRDATTGQLLFTEMISNIFPAADQENHFLYRNFTLVFTGKRSASDVNALKVQKIFYKVN